MAAPVPHILLVDDDREIRDLVSPILVEHGFRVTAVGDGRGMREALEVGRFDLVVLDIMLPGETGLELCRHVRATSAIPVIMLTALSGETDRIIGLEIGADDYLTKPFSPRELVARARAVLRRAHALPPAAEKRGRRLRFDGWTADLVSRDLRDPRGVLVALSSGEFDLMRAFLEHPQRTLSREQLLDLCRGRNAVLFDRAIDMQISRLRRKIEANPADPRFIRTVRNGGYIFTAAVTEDDGP